MEIYRRLPEEVKLFGSAAMALLVLAGGVVALTHDDVVARQQEIDEMCGGEERPDCIPHQELMVGFGGPVVMTRYATIAPTPGDSFPKENLGEE